MFVRSSPSSVECFFLVVSLARVISVRYIRNLFCRTCVCQWGFKDTASSLQQGYTPLSGVYPCCRDDARKRWHTESGGLNLWSSVKTIFSMARSRTRGLVLPHPQETSQMECVQRLAGGRLCNGSLCDMLMCSENVSLLLYTDINRYATPTWCMCHMYPSEASMHLIRRRHPCIFTWKNGRRRVWLWNVFII